MSVLIKGMKMPENCHECEFVDILPTCPCNKMADDDFWNNVSLAVEGHTDCPIIGVPPHGRLIDADELKTKYFCGENVEHDKIRVTVDNVLHFIDNAPTVIPADKDGEI